MTSFKTIRRRPTALHSASSVVGRHAAWAAVAATLAACGGGGSSDGAASGLDAASTSARALDASAAAEGDWVRIADENQSFSVQGTQTVRYGSGSSWVEKSVSGGGECSNGGFGTDPLVGVFKECRIAATWTPIADEHQAFGVQGTQTVRYGIGANWIVKTVTGSAECSNEWFGSDPALGIVKVCQGAGGSAVETGWARIAGEGESFGVNGTQTVRYGSGAAWVTKTVSGSGQCTNEGFGLDPLVGVVKQCEVASASAVAPSPSPAPAPSPSPAPDPTAGVCSPPVAALDTSSASPGVGDGTPGSCTEAALRAAVASRDVVTFNCGAGPVTIRVTAPIAVPTDRNTVIDGAGKVTLDGGGATRILSLMRSDYRTNSNGLTLQRIALVNGRAAGSGYVAQDPNAPQCAWGYAEGGGGAIEVRDARLHVIDVEFRSNAAASPGPDVGGGAIHAFGSLDVTVVGSRFVGNTGSNGGAVGLLQSNGRFVNSVFEGNSATGVGMNSIDPGCPGVGHPGQSGAGGSSGAISVDGSDDTDLLVCGSRFVANTARELAGALSRTANGSPRRTTIDRSVFDGNRARQGGALFISNAAPLEIVASTFSNNAAVVFGAAQIERGSLAIVNSTFAGNEATQGVGGALYLANLDGASSIRNATFANNRSMAGGGYFAAAVFGQLNFPIVNTVFSGNLTQDGGSPMQCSFSPAPGAFDMQWPRDHLVGGAPDFPCVDGIVFADPALGALADNGGPTPTLVPAGGSPLRGAGRDCPATDQRGQPRNAAQCTIGAVE